MNDFINTYKTRINVFLEKRLPVNSDLNEAMHYSVLGKSKRIRALLVYAAGKDFNANDEVLDHIAAAVELVHAYSLVHDDLPAMDNDDLRRGKLSCHKKYNEATAILVGDALQSMAFELLSSSDMDSLSSQQQISIINIFANAIGSQGMVGGQSMDMASEGKTIALEKLEDIHTKKTAALITASLLMGATAGSSELEELNSLQALGKQLGLAFQIHDDILDIEGETVTIGKEQGSDMARNKATYPSILGLEQAKQLLSEQQNAAMKTLEKLDAKAVCLTQVAEYILKRRY